MAVGTMLYQIKLQTYNVHSKLLLELFMSNKVEHLL